MLKKLILVFKTHFDIGFTDLASNVIRDYSTKMLDQVLETCRATAHMGNQKYVWTMPAWPLYVVDRQCDSERGKELEHFIRSGQIAWHALPFTSHTDFCGEEEYLESLRYGKWLAEKYGKPYPITAKMTDVPGHGRMLPELLGASGIRFLHLGCNAFATPPAVPLLFYWEAPSGRRVLTMYCRGGYGSGLEPPKDWPFPVWMALMHTHDNCGPQSAEAIRRLVEKAKKCYPDAEIVCGTMDDFVRELEGCDLREVPVVTSDLADTWIHGIGAYPAEVREIRELRRNSTGLQKAYESFRMLSDSGIQLPSPDGFYENMHLFGEHTWGADVKTWLGPERVYEKEEFLEAKKQDNYRFMEDSWQEQRERAKLCEAELEKYAAGCEDKLLQNPEAVSDGSAGFFYNPSAACYRGWIEYADGKQNIFGKKSAFAPGVSPFSTVDVRKLETLEETPLIIRYDGACAFVENHRYRLEFDEDSGVIFRLSDLRQGHVLLEKRGETDVFSYRYYRYGIERMTEFLRSYGYRFHAWGVQDYGRENYPECEDECFKPEFIGIRVQGSSITFSYRGGKGVEKYGDAEGTEVTVTLPPLGDELFVELKLKNKQETPCIESGCFFLPLAVTKPQYRFQKNGSLLDPSRDIALDANHAYYALEHMAAAREGAKGLAVLPLDTPLLALGEDGCYRFSRQYEETEPIFCFNLFNNMWGTNFPQWQGGDFSFRYVLRSYTPEEEPTLLDWACTSAAGLRPVRQPVPRLPLVLPDGMELLNLRKEGEGFLLVTRDVSGRESREYVELPGFFLSETDYYGRRSGELRADRLEFLRRRYGIHLFFAERKADVPG